MNLIKEKRCSKIKGRTCDGVSTKGYILREDASSPTISLEAIITTLVVDAYEGQDVVIFDVTGSYLNSGMPDEKYSRLQLEGKLVDIMCDMNSNRISNIWY